MTNALTAARRPFWRALGRKSPQGMQLVDGRDAPFFPIDLPPTLRGRRRQRVALRHLRTSLGEGDHELHPFTTGPKLVGMVAVARETVTAWRKEAPDQSRPLVPDYLTIPAIPDVWTIESGPTIRARLGLTDAFSAEPELAVAQLQRATPPKAILRLGRPCPVLDTYLAARAEPQFSSVQALRQAGFPTPLAQKKAVGGVSLLHAPGDPSAAQARPLAVPSVVSAGALALWMVGLHLEHQKLQVDIQQTRNDTAAMVRAHFVPKDPLLDIRAQVLRAQNLQISGVDDPLAVLELAAGAFVDASVVPGSVTYHPERGLVARAEAKDAGHLKQIVTAMSDHGVKATVISDPLSAGGRSTLASLHLEISVQ